MHQRVSGLFTRLEICQVQKQWRWDEKERMIFKSIVNVLVPLLSAELSRLQKQLNLILILLVVVLLLLAVNNGIRMAKWCKGRGFCSNVLRKLKLKKRSKTEKMAPEDLTHANPNTQSPKVQLRSVPPRTQLQINNRESTVFSIDGASTIQTVSTPISTRYPAEDSTLSYSYDNAGLAVTPTIPERPF